MGFPKRLLGFGAVVSFAAAAAAHVWARHIEIHLFTLREVELRILPPGSGPVRLLHMSDAHLLPEQTRKRNFLRFLASTKPDAVVNTGDNVASAEAIPALLADIAPLIERPGALVLGSNDKFAAGKRNIFRYFLKDPRPKGYQKKYSKPDLPVDELVAGLTAGGWKNLSNGRAVLELPGCDLEFVGVDDPHLDHDKFPSKAQPHVAAEGRNSIKIGIAHAPYLRVLDAFVDEGCDLMVAGHTHGGQLAIPFYGAIVTNCDLPPKKAKGLSEHRGVPLHVSGGLGASPFYNMRFANRPEATIITLRERD